MKIIGCDFHTRYQQIAMMDESTGELIERRLLEVAVEVGQTQIDHGDVHGVYKKLHEPSYPTQDEIRELRAAAEIKPETRDLTNGELRLPIPAHGLAVIELK